MKPFRKKLISALLIMSLLFLLPADVFALQGNPDEMPAETAPVMSAGENADTSSLIRIRDTVFNINENASDWSNGSGWRNDLANHYIAFVNYNGSDTSLTTSEKEVTLAMSGLNRLGNISAGNHVNIIGTGILLLDGIEMAEGAELRIQPDTRVHAKGSVAVFLKQSGNIYTLLNRPDVPGILDEAYTVPANTALSLPSGTSLDLCAMAVKKEIYIDDTGKELTDIHYYVNENSSVVTTPDHGGTVTIETTAAQLTIPATSSLTVAEGAAVNLHEINYYNSKTVSKLTAGGTLNLFGTICGNKGTVAVQGGGILAGSGSVSDAFVYLDVTAATSDQIRYMTDNVIASVSSEKNWNPILDNSTLILQNVDTALGSLSVSGRSCIAYRKNTSVGSIAIADGGVLELLATGSIKDDAAMTLNGAVTGGSLRFGSGRFVIGAGCTITSNTGITSSVDEYDAIICDYTGALPVSDFPAVLTGQKAEELQKASADDIRLDSVYIAGTIWPWQYYSANIGSAKPGTDESRIKRGDNNAAPAEDILAAAGYQNLSDADNKIYFVEALGMDSDGRLSCDVYGIAEMIDLTNVYLLRTVVLTLRETAEGGGASTSTNTTYTGTGVLGNNTGSLLGGASTMIYKGTGRKEPDLNKDSNENNNNNNNNNNNSNNNNNNNNDNNNNNNNNNNNDNNNNNNNNNNNTNSNTNTNNNNGNNKTNNTGNNNTNNSRQNRAGRTGTGTTGIRTGGQASQSNARTGASRTVSENGTDSSDAAGGTGTGRSDAEETADAADGTGVLKPEKEAGRAGTSGTIEVVVEDVTYNSAAAGAPIYRKLSAWEGDKKITELTNSVRVTVPRAFGEKTGKALYAVFVDQNEEIFVFPVIYDKNKDKFQFDSGKTGNFVITALDNGYPAGSAELFKQCRASREVRILTALMRVYSFWS